MKYASDAKMHPKLQRCKYEIAVKLGDEGFPKREIVCKEGIIPLYVCVINLLQSIPVQSMQLIKVVIDKLNKSALI